MATTWASASCCSRPSDEEKDVMVASIGPFWDANETWLVLGIGLLLVAFPRAHGVILTALYLPVVLMLIGLIAARRGLRFPRQGPCEAQAAVEQPVLGRLAGSPRLSQGYMLGRYITGFQQSLARAWLSPC